MSKPTHDALGVRLERGDGVDGPGKLAAILGPLSQDPALRASLGELGRSVVTERFSPQDWNIYAAQVSDGDNSSTDAARTERLVTEEILPAVQYFAYLEVGSDEGPRRAGFVAQKSELWRTYEGLRSSGAPISDRIPFSSRIGLITLV